MKTSQITYSFLALGDSYTIGEMVKPEDNFPNQVTTLLRQKGLTVNDPEIIAKTGWTTDELADAIKTANPTNHYDFVSLLIGVNNQYRGRDIGEYAIQFESLLKQAIYFARTDASKVVVISIPDWGITPYAAGRDKNEIARQIDAFNEVNKSVALKYKVKYIDITPGSRQASEDTSLLADDELHPSGKEYRKWAISVAEYFFSTTLSK